MAFAAEGGVAMPNKRNFDMKRRETERIPAEKLLSILRGIYTEETAQELFNTLQRPKRGVDKENADG